MVWALVFSNSISMQIIASHEVCVNKAYTGRSLYHTWCCGEAMQKMQPCKSVIEPEEREEFVLLMDHRSRDAALRDVPSMPKPVESVDRMALS